MSLTLTRGDGSVIYFGHGFVVSPVPHGHQVTEGSRSLVIYAGANHFVREEPAEIVAQIEGAAARGEL